MAALPPLVVSLLVTAGGMAAQYALMPRVKQQPTDVGKLDDLRITGSEYGTFIPRLWGKARLGANIVWSSGIDHRIIDYPAQGGKGVPQAPATRTHVYSADLGMQICRGLVDGFGKIWADADVIGGAKEGRETFEAELGTLSGTAEILDPDPTASAGKSVRYIGDIGIGTAGKVVINTSLLSPRPPVDPDNDTQAVSTLQIFYKATTTRSMNILVKDSTNATIYNQTQSFANTNGEWIGRNIIITGGTFAHTIELSNPSSPAPQVDKIVVNKYYQKPLTSGEYLKFTQTTGLLDPNAAYDDSLDPSAFFDYAPTFDANGSATAGGLPFNIIKFYQGATNQLQDPYHEDYLDTRYGAGNGIDYLPAYRETAMVVFHDYQLRQGRIPNYTFEVFNNQTSVNLVLEDLYADCGLISTDYDLGNTSSMTFVGIVESQKMSRKAMIESIGRYFGFRIAEFNGKINIINDYSFTSAGSVSSDLLRATNYGDEMPAYDAEVLLSPKNELPKEVRFNVMNPNFDYHNETVTASLFADISSSDSSEYSFPIVDDLEQARKRAEFLLLKTHTEASTITFQAMPEIMRYSVGDNIEVTLNNIPMLIRIEKMTAGIPIGVVEVQGVVLEEYNPSEIQVTVTEIPSVQEYQLAASIFPRNSKAIPIISQPIRQMDKARLGCYIAVTPTGQGASENIALYREVGADNYVIQDILDVPAVCGVTDGTLGSHGDPSVEDTTNTLDILFYNETSLESVTAGDISRYPTLNLIRVGNEWIQFRTATLQTLPTGSSYRSKWRISNLMRGRFGTSGAMSGHGASEDSVVWTNNLKFYDLYEEDIGQTVNLKTTTGGQDIADVKTISFTFNPVSKYTITNDTTDRTMDANCTTINELSDVVSTIIDDLKL
jgi:hypothetical protein